MKAKCTLSIEKPLVRSGKALRKRRGSSLSGLIESMLRRLRVAEEPLFADYWRGRFSHIKDPDAERMRFLRERYE